MKGRNITIKARVARDAASTVNFLPIKENWLCSALFAVTQLPLDLHQYKLPFKECQDVKDLLRVRTWLVGMCPKCITHYVHHHRRKEAYVTWSPQTSLLEELQNVKHIVNQNNLNYIQKLCEFETGWLYPRALWLSFVVLKGRSFYCQENCLSYLSLLFMYLLHINHIWPQKTEKSW